MTATTKGDIILGAFSLMRINGLTVGPDGFDNETALDRLENFAAMLCSRNICTSYNFTENPNLSDLTNIPIKYNIMMESNLAVYLCPDYGKEVPPVLAALAASTMNTASASCALEILQPVTYPDRMPVGSGNLRYFPYNNFRQGPALPPESCTTHDMFVGDINDYTENYTQYLGSAETVASYTIEADQGLLIVSDSLSSPVISYRIEALSQQTTGNWQQVKIVVTTSTGRINTRLINFNVLQSQTVGSN